MKIRKMTKSISLIVLSLMLVFPMSNSLYKSDVLLKSYAATEPATEEQITSYFMDGNNGNFIGTNSNEDFSKLKFGDNSLKLVGYQTFGVDFIREFLKKKIFDNYYNCNCVGWIATKEPITGINSSTSIDDYARIINQELKKIKKGSPYEKFIYNSDKSGDTKDNLKKLKEQGYKYFYSVFHLIHVKKDDLLKYDPSKGIGLENLSGDFKPSYDIDGSIVTGSLNSELIENNGSHQYNISKLSDNLNLQIKGNLEMDPIISIATYFNSDQLTNSGNSGKSVLINGNEKVNDYEKGTYVDIRFDIDENVDVNKKIQAEFNSLNFMPKSAFLVLKNEENNEKRKEVNNFFKSKKNDSGSAYTINFDVPEQKNVKAIVFRMELKNTSPIKVDFPDFDDISRDMSLKFDSGLGISKDKLIKIINNSENHSAVLNFKGKVTVNIAGQVKSSISLFNSLSSLFNKKQPDSDLVTVYSSSNKYVSSNDELTLTFSNDEVKSEPVEPKVITRTVYKPVVCSCPITKVYGENRIETANKIAEKYFGKSNTVILAMKDQFPDSLTSTVLSKQLNAPILLTSTDKLDSSVKNEIKQLGASHVIIVGGKNSVSENVENEIKDSIDNNVERLSGNDRYGTSDMVARKVVDITGKLNKAVVASGEVFPDALSISPFAAYNGYPILLVRKNSVPEEIKKAMNDLEIKDTYLIGGKNTVSDMAYSELPNVLERIQGRDRYETSIEISKEKFPDSKKAFLTSGEVFSDALVIGPVAGKYNSPVLLTPHNELDSLRKYIDSSNIKEIVAVGGPKYLPSSIFYLLDKKDK